jgi:hypothetical protein
MGLLGCNWFKMSFGRLVLLRAVLKIPVSTGGLGSLLRDGAGSSRELCG